MDSYKRLTKYETNNLLKQLKEGNKEAVEKLFNGNLFLVIYVVEKKFSFCKTVSKMDMIQEGNLGLLDAINNFDLSLGYNFSKFAFKCIFNAILKLILEMQKSFRIPMHKSAMYKSYIEERNKLSYELNREPTLEEIALRLNFSKKLVEELYLLDFPMISLNEPFEDDDTEVGSLLQKEDDNFELAIDNLLNNELHDYIYQMMDKIKLSSKEKKIMILRYGLNGNKPMTQVEIAKLFKESKQNIWRIEKSIKKKIIDSSYIFDLVQFSDEPEKILKNLGYDAEFIKRKIK